MSRRNVSALFLVAFLALVVCGEDPSPARGQVPLLPDVVEEIPQHLSIQNQQQREYLRFSSTHWNVGRGPLQLEGGIPIGPCTIDGVSYPECSRTTQHVLDAAGNVVVSKDVGFAVFHPTHNHFHMSDVADFSLRVGSPVGPKVATLEKVSFCLIDYDKSAVVGPNNTRFYFDCDGTFQGISPGWGDEYHHSTDGQKLDITDIVDGSYWLTNTADPGNTWIEADKTNNSSWVKIKLSGKGTGNRKIQILEESPCAYITQLGPFPWSVCETGGNK